MKPTLPNNFFLRFVNPSFKTKQRFAYDKVTNNYAYIFNLQHHIPPTE